MERKGLGGQGERREDRITSSNIRRKRIHAWISSASAFHKCDPTLLLKHGLGKCVTISQMKREGEGGRKNISTPRKEGYGRDLQAEGRNLQRGGKGDRKGTSVNKGGERRGRE